MNEQMRGDTGRDKGLTELGKEPKNTACEVTTNLQFL